MVHIALHFLVPWLIAMVMDRDRRLRTWLVLVATMAVDVDHLMADPIYDPSRCSIEFHPLHTVPMIAVYALMFAVPLVMKRVGAMRDTPAARVVFLIGLGLVVHMMLDGIDCLI